MNEPSVSILCVTHGRPDLLKECIGSCAEQDFSNFDILVVINPVDAISESAVLEVAPAAKIIRTHRNLGFFPALNVALANSSSDYVMIVDDDARFVSRDAVRLLVEEFRKAPELGAVTCNLQGPDETPITGGDRFVSVFTTGFTMMPRKAVTEWVDYFPDVFFRSAGESFLCTQLWEQERPVKRVEQIRMYHARARVGRSMRDWRFYGLRSQVLCAIMREPIGWLFPVLLSKFLKSFVLAVRQRRVGVWFHAWMSSLFHLDSAIKFRKPISHRTRRLLARLDRKIITDLRQCPEWRPTNRAAELLAST